MTKRRKKKQLAEGQLIGLRHAFELTKTTAKGQGLLFSLDFSEYVKITLSRCYYCDSEGTIPYTTKHKRLNAERVNRLKHFTSDNVVPTCVHCAKILKYTNQKRLRQTRRICTKLIARIGSEK